MKNMMQTFVNTKAQIWGDESHACTIIYAMDTNTYYAKCESTFEQKRLTESNYERVLNDMFYDYCVENADWMGVS